MEWKPGEAIEVRHELWQGALIVDADPRRLRHSLHGTQASFQAAGNLLWVDWDAYGPEVFVREGEAYVLAGLRPRQPAAAAGGSVDPNGPLRARVAGTSVEIDAVSLRLPGDAGSALVRPATSDVPVFEAIFFAGDYDVPILGEDCDIVVDLGANTGLSSLYLSQRCPKATLVAVEPARANFAVLAANVQDRPRIIPVEAAIWPRDGSIELQDAEASGTKMQPWAYRTVERDSGLGRYAVEAISIPTLMARYGLGAIDVLKIDIEGAEYELFSGDVAAWLPKTRAVLIETHERFRAGTDELVSGVLSPHFVELAPRGENRVFVRRE
jgi:FkbM family methyltransferase